MLRRCLLLRRTTGHYERVRDAVSGDEGYMTLQQACTIFGFQLNERWTRREVKRRYRALALRFHPDHGGTDAQFRALAEAHALLMSHRHDKANLTDEADDAAAASSSPRRRATVFHRMHYDEMHNTIHRQTADAPELRSVGVRDVVLFVTCAIVALGYYVRRTVQTQQHIMQSRWSYTSAQMTHNNNSNNEAADEEGNSISSSSSSKNARQWHPWRADVETSDRMDRVGLLQGNIRREVVAEREAKAPPVHMPWHAGGPFVARPVASQATTTTTAVTAATVTAATEQQVTPAAVASRNAVKSSDMDAGAMAHSSDATAAATAATAALASRSSDSATPSPPHHDDADEVAQLRAALRASEEKLQSWKAQVQVAVEQLRHRVRALTAQLRASEAARAAMQEQAAAATAAASSPSPPSATVDAVTHDAQTAHDAAPPSPQQQQQQQPLWLLSSLLLHDMADACGDSVRAKLDVFARAVHTQLAAVTTAAVELDAQRRRTAATLRLQLHSHDALQAQLREAHEALATAQSAAAAHARDVAARDEAVAALEARLAAAAAAAATATTMTMRAPAPDELDEVRSAAEQELQQLRDEHALLDAAREARHRDEVQQLIAAHERDVSALRRALADATRHSAALTRRRDDTHNESSSSKNSAAATAATSVTSHHHNSSNDDMYTALLRDYQALQTAYDAVLQRQQQQQGEQHDGRYNDGIDARLTATHVGNDNGSSGSSSSSSSKHATALLVNSTTTATTTAVAALPTSLSEALTALQELRGGAEVMRNELCKAKAELVTLRQRVAQQPTLPAGALAAQQVAYLRSVLVALLVAVGAAARDDDGGGGDGDKAYVSVVSRLLPVLCALLHFTCDELAHIGAAHPLWASVVVTEATRV